MTDNVRDKLKDEAAKWGVGAIKESNVVEQIFRMDDGDLANLDLDKVKEYLFSAYILLLYQQKHENIYWLPLQFPVEFLLILPKAQNL